MHSVPIGIRGAGEGAPAPIKIFSLKFVQCAVIFLGTAAADHLSYTFGQVTTAPKIKYGSYTYDSTTHCVCTLVYKTEKFPHLPSNK